MRELRDADDLGIEPGGVVDGTAELGLATRRVGRRLHYLRSATSTNATLAALAAQGEPSGSVVLADGQTEGRGRGGRPWFSPTGRGIWVSVLVRADMPAQRLAPLSVSAAVSIAEVLNDLTGLDVRVKWPNDIMTGGRKLGGILVEAMQIADEDVRAAILGIGLNVNLDGDSMPEDIAESATSLRIALGHDVSRLDVLRAVLWAIETCEDAFSTDGLESFRSRWRKLSVLRGRRVLVRTPGRDVEGVVTDLAPSGALVLAVEGGGLEEIWHGDVGLSPMEQESTAG